MLDFIDQYPDLKETPAQFQERCGQIALARFWEEQRPRKTLPLWDGSVIDLERDPIDQYEYEVLMGSKT